MSLRCELCGELNQSAETLRCERCQNSDFKPASALWRSPFYALEGLMRVVANVELLRLALLPILLTGLILGAVLIWGLSSVFAGLNTWLAQSMRGGGALMALQGVSLAFASFALAVLFLFLFLPVSSLVCLPFLDQISQKVEALILGKPQQPPASLALGFILKEMFLLLGFKLVVLVLGLPLLLIPVLGFPIFLFLMGLLTAVDFLDLLLSRKGFSFTEKLSYLKDYFLPFALFSLPVVGMAWIPLLQLLILPGAAAGGVLFYLHHPKPVAGSVTATQQGATGVSD